MPTLTGVLFLLAGFVSWLIAQYCFDPVFYPVAVAISSPSRLQTAFAVVAGPLFTWAFDYQFTIWICAVKLTLLDDPYTPPSLVGLNICRSFYFALAMVGAIIGEKKRKELRRQIDGLANQSTRLQAIVVNSLATGMPIDHVRDLFEGIAIR
ncbi:hypothetical protein PMAYCL1PPCAC_10527, partial [Pristionchus mayeri]